MLICFTVNKFTFWWCSLKIHPNKSHFDGVWNYLSCTSYPKNGTDDEESRELEWGFLQLNFRLISCSFSFFPWVRNSHYTVVFLWNCINHIIKYLWDFDFVPDLIKRLHNYLRRRRDESGCKTSLDASQTLCWRNICLYLPCQTRAQSWEHFWSLQTPQAHQWSPAESSRTTGSSWESMNEWMIIH